MGKQNGICASLEWAVVAIFKYVHGMSLEEEKLTFKFRSSPEGTYCIRPQKFRYQLAEGMNAIKW